MQLNTRRRHGTLAASLGVAVSQLLCATPAQAQDAPSPLSDRMIQILRAEVPQNHRHDRDPLSRRMANLLRTDAPQRLKSAAPPLPVMQATPAGPGTTTAETAVLFYQERGGRVRAIEPTAALTVNRTNGDVLTGSLTYDTLTGATPNGALPSAKDQTFSQTIPVSSSQSTTTGASGRTITQSGTTSGVAQSSYVVPAGTLPLDGGFKDRRIAGSLGYSAAIARDLRVKLGGAVSSERDYASYSGNIGLSRDLDGKNTTLSLAVNFEHDFSHPFYGTPKGFDPLINQITGANQTKDVISAIAGLTQTMARNWLTQLNVDYGSSQGYQSDPYKILSLINVADGTTVKYLFENRPRHRSRESVYWLNKVAIAQQVAEVSLRYYHDSWGINAVTAQVSDRIGLGRSVYVEPMARYYHQTAANFFRYYLDSSAALPAYASADGRLGTFSARTFGMKLGMRLSTSLSVYIAGEEYRQFGAHTLVNAPAPLTSLDVFSGTRSISAMSGVRLGI